MRYDRNGLAISTTSEAAAQGYNDALTGYVLYRADTGKVLAEAIAADPEFGIAHCLRGYLTMLTYRQANLATAGQALAQADRWTASATERERMHVAALRHWVEGELERAIGVWEQILRDHPRDELALRLGHFVNFWFGRPVEMRASVERVLPHWNRAFPGYGTALACLAFASEECGHYTEAEAAGRAAVAFQPAEMWATHAVAHVLEMQGRRDEGAQWIAGLRHHWDGANNFRHHLWWHAALFHLEHRDFQSVLALYDEQIRKLTSPLVTAQPDLYVDIQNAASLLFRLELQGVAIGERWNEIADKAEARIGDCLSAFTLPHWMMALAASGRERTAQDMLAAMRAFAQGAGTVPHLVGTYAVPLCEAVLAHRKGEYSKAVAQMRPVLGEMHQLGGSHAQQDVLEQLYLDCAVRAGLASDVRLLLERVSGRHPVPVSRRIGYQAAAHQARF